METNINLLNKDPILLFILISSVSKQEYLLLSFLNVQILTLYISGFSNQSSLQFPSLQLIFILCYQQNKT